MSGKKRSNDPYIDRNIRRPPNPGVLEDLLVVFDGFATPGRLRAGWKAREKRLQAAKDMVKDKSSTQAPLRDSTPDGSRAAQTSVEQTVADTSDAEPVHMAPGPTITSDQASDSLADTSENQKA